MRAKDRYPAYIPSKNFILAVVQQLGPDFPKDMLAEIEKSNLPPGFKQVLKDFAIDSNNDFEKFKKNMETFYNNVMDRASGWYKKKIRRVLLIIGILLAIILNIDTIRIVNDALRDKKQLQATTDRIADLLPNISADSSSVTIRDKDQNVVFQQNVKVNIDSAQMPDKTKRAQLKQLTLQYEDVTGYHLGYPSWASFQNEWFSIRPDADKQEGTIDTIIHFLAKLLGVIITGFALQVSANYWFDLMNKAVNIRAVGKRPNGEQNP
jgi:hypothetical protein